MAAAAPPRELSPAEGAALQQASQYAGSPTPWTPENAPNVGLDPERGFIARGVPTPPAPQSPTPIEPRAQSMAPGLGSAGGAPIDQKPSASEDPRVQAIPEAKKPAESTKKPEDPRVEAVPEKPQPAEDPRVEAIQPPTPAQTQPQPPAQQPAPQPQPEKPAEQQPQAPADDRDAKIQALIQGGKTPGEAQAIIDGQQPTTITGEAPPPKTEPAPKTEQPQQQTPAAPKAEVTLKAGAGNAVDPRALYSYLLGKFANSGLVGYVPPDGARWGIKTGSAAEWAAFGLAVAKQESDLNTRSYNAADPGGSAGLFQFGQGQTQFTGGRDQFDPQASADAFVKSVQHYLANKGSIANLGETFGSIRRPNEAGQYIAGAQKVAAGGSGKDLVSSGGGGGGPRRTGKGGDGGGSGDDSLLFNVPFQQGYNPAAQQPLSFDDGGGGRTPDYREAPTQSDAGSLNFGALVGAALAGTAAGSLFRGGEEGGGRRQAAQPTEEPGPSPSALVAKVLQAGGPPPAPGGPVDLSTMKPANVLSVKTPGAPQLGLPAPPAAPSAAPAAPDPLVIKGLMKAGFTFEQANAFAAKARVSKPGAAAVAGAASFRKPAQPSAAAAAPQRPPSTAPPSKPPPAPGPPPSNLFNLAAQRAQQSKALAAKHGFDPYSGEGEAAEAEADALRQEARGGKRQASTIGVAKPAGSEALAGLALSQALKQHATLLSPDDPRVKKQADNMTKGEHFVPGDPVHEDLLNGLPGGHGGRQRRLLGQAETAIADRSPMHISYISAPKEAQKFPTRESRTIQYDEHSPEARLMGTTEGQLVGHSFIPTAVGVSPSRKAGEPHQSYIQGISTNVIANNFAHLNTKLAAMGEKSPYASFGPKFANDLEGYLHNLNAGHTGTGRGYAIGTAEHPNEPDESHVPYKLTRHEADFLNTVINNTGAFAKHEDAKALRELARVNGTLITPEGETNRLRHQIELHEPGWRDRVLEPSIRSFKTGLVHEVHPTEEHMPATIRPGQDYRSVTEAMQRTSERGRPDVPVAISLHHTFADNKAINQIEREFSEERISEAEARARLHALGEDPDQYRFVGGSGGLITPYEENPEAITPEEHSQLKDNLRKQWISGKMPIEDYRKKTAEVPLPEIPSRPDKESAAAAPPAPKEVSETPKKPGTDPDHAMALKLWKEHGTEGLKKILQTSMTVRELKDKYGLELSGEKMHRVLSGAAAFPKIAAFYSKLPGPEQPSGGVLKMDTGGIVPSPSDFTSMIAGQPMSESEAAARAMPVTKTPAAPDDSYFASAATTPAAPPSGTPGPVVMPTESGYSTIPPETRRALPVDQGDPTRLGGLVDSRARYAQEMSDHPELRGKVMAITDAEVGDDNPQAKQALIETIFNRAASRGMSLSATLASRHNPKTGTGYWAPESWDKANAMSAQDLQALSPTYNPMIDRALGGSNVSNLSTGNQSPPVKSGGAPISFNPQGKHGNTFVIENRDAKWVAGMKKAQAAGSGEPETTSWTSPGGISSVPAAPAYDEYED